MGNGGKEKRGEEGDERVTFILKLLYGCSTPIYCQHPRLSDWAVCVGAVTLSLIY